jgi:uncharacterized Zn finger protein (UPF0148 family)
MFCGNCGTKIEDGVNKCLNCGLTIPAMELHCSVCGFVLKEGSLFCGNCGNKIGGIVNQNKEIGIPENKNMKKKLEKKDISKLSFEERMAYYKDIYKK